jgi:hypothetical protein
VTVRGERTWQAIGALPLIDEDPDGAREHDATLLDAKPRPRAPSCVRQAA